MTMELYEAILEGTRDNGWVSMKKSNIEYSMDLSRFGIHID